jgi:hypothetical protein
MNHQADHTHPSTVEPAGPSPDRREFLRIAGTSAAAAGMLQQAPPARLVILPATSHVGISGESAVLVPLVSAFLDDVPPTTPDLF